MSRGNARGEDVTNTVLLLSEHLLFEGARGRLPPLIVLRASPIQTRVQPALEVIVAPIPRRCLVPILPKALPIKESSATGTDGESFSQIHRTRLHRSRISKSLAADHPNVVNPAATTPIGEARPISWPGAFCRILRRVPMSSDLLAIRDRRPARCSLQGRYLDFHAGPDRSRASRQQRQTSDRRALARGPAIRRRHLLAGVDCGPYRIQRERGNQGRDPTIP